MATDTVPPQNGTDVASRAVDAVKTYGEGATAVTALNHMNVAFYPKE